MNRSTLVNQIKAKSSYLCVGLDTDIQRLPSHLLQEEDPVFEFNKQIIDATQDLCVAYKPNLAFYEAHGAKGWESLKKTLEYIPETHFTIADAKRGDIGNTANMYARAFFDELNVDSITIAPYMGKDSVTPFLNYEGKWAIVLALTSNAGSQDFQFSLLEEESPLYKRVIRKATEWGTPENLMFVIGATHPTFLAEIRQMVPDHFFLVPGVGAQGGSLEEVSRVALNDDIGILVNSSRGILYTGDGKDFASKSRAVAQRMQEQMAGLLEFSL